MAAFHATNGETRLSRVTRHLLVGALAVLCSTYGATSGGAPNVQAKAPLRPPVETLPASRGGQDVVGSRLPPLAFERWPDAGPGGGDAAPAEPRVTLYRWWTNECPHCEGTLPAVDALRRKYGPRGLRVVAVYHPKPPREVEDADVRAWARALGYEGAVAVDQDWSELKKFYLSKGRRAATSAAFLVDRDGVIRFAHPGPRFYPSEDPAEAEHDRDYRLLDRAVDAVLAGP